MNEEQHIIKFKHTYSLHKKLDIDDDFYINSYRISKNRQDYIDTNVSYLNLHIRSHIFLKYYNHNIFNLSNMLYKIHNPNYYRRYNHKELI